MATEALPQVGAESVIYGTAVRVVGVHIAERDTIGQARRSRVASGIQPGCLHVCERERNTRSECSSGQRRIQSRRPEKADQGCRNVER